MQLIMQNPLLHAILVVVLPIIIIPLLMRFIIGRIVIYRARQKYLPLYLKKQQGGWHTAKDRETISTLNTFALQRLKGGLVFKPDLKEDVQTILLCIQAVHRPESVPAGVSFSFSVRKLLDCSLLFFSDLYKEFAGKAWFRLIRRIRLGWVSRIWNVRKYYEIIFSNPMLEKLRRARVPGKLVRLVFIPLIGLPSLIWYVIRSIVFSVFFEGFMRFFYALVLLKIGYYALYLYGRENKTIRRRIRTIPRKKLADVHKRIRSLLSPSSWAQKSVLYPRAAAVYAESLLQLGIAPDPEVSPPDPGLPAFAMGILNRVKSTLARIYSNANPFIRKQVKQNALLGVLLNISAVYAPRSNRPYNYLRLDELMTLGYMASVMIIYKINTTPGINLLFANMSVDFALKLGSVARREEVVQGVRTIRGLYKYYRLYRIGAISAKMLRGLSGPTGLVLTLGGSLLFQQARDLLQEYMFHTAARLVLFTWESHMLSAKNTLRPLLV
jgi:hypothetical protein